MRALVLSGGGSKCSFAVGALQYILGELETDYQIFCGVSAGAINCALLSMFKDNEAKQASIKLTDLWSQLDNSKIYKRWFPFGKLHTLWKKSFYDSSPMHNLIKSNIDLNAIRDSNKNVSVGTVSLSSGKYTYFDQSSDYFLDAVIASASFPGAFEPVNFAGQLWTDGGLKEMSPIRKAIEMGADIIDVIITSPQTRVKHFIEKPSVLDILKRSFDLSTDKIMQNNIDHIEAHNKLAAAGLSNKKQVKLNVLRPDYNLIEDLLDFSPKKIQEMMKRGYYDAKHKYLP